MSIQAQETPLSKAKFKGRGSLKGVGAFIFGVFGTVVDWCTNFGWFALALCRGKKVNVNYRILDPGVYLLKNGEMHI